MHQEGEQTWAEPEQNLRSHTSRNINTLVVEQIELAG
jgi:hypothetical protein